MKYRLNLTSSLANTKSLLQVGVYHMMEWHEICHSFNEWNRTFSNKKEAYGFSLGDFKTYNRDQWRVKLYEYFLKAEANLSKLTTERNTKQDRALLYKYNKVSDENKRLTLLNELFPQGTWITGFHRVAADCVTKHAVILDIDNTALKGDPRTVPYLPAMIQIDEIKNILKGYNYILYTSYSHTPTKPKFRVIIPTDKPYNKRESHIIREWFLNNISVRGKMDYFFNLIDITAFEMPRFFYVPVHHVSNREPGCTYYCSEFGSNFLSVDKMLLQTKINQHTYTTWKFLKRFRKENIINE